MMRAFLLILLITLPPPPPLPAIHLFCTIAVDRPSHALSPPIYCLEAFVFLISTTFSLPSLSLPPSPTLLVLRPFADHHVSLSIIFVSSSWTTRTSSCHGDFHTFNELFLSLSFKGCLIFDHIKPCCYRHHSSCIVIPPSVAPKPLPVFSLYLRMFVLPLFVRSWLTLSP